MSLSRRPERARRAPPRPANSCHRGHYDCPVTPAELSAAVVVAVSDCIAAGDFSGTVPSDAVGERPKNAEHGDYATNVALRLAKPAGKPARDVAEAIAVRLRIAPGIARVD